MYYKSWLVNITILLTLISFNGLLCAKSFYNFRRNVSRIGDDPCKPLYWYPKTIPEYCYYKNEMTPKPDEFQPPIPMPIPVPLPPPMPLPPPIPLPQPPSPPLFPPILPPIYPLPFGIPLSPTNPMLPIAGIPFLPPSGFMPKQVPPLMPPPPSFPSPFASYVPPYGIQRRGMSMVPGLPGMVSPEGGINILPFSDAYADLLEKHKQKMIRKRLQKLLDEYDKHPWKGSYEDTRRMDTRRVNNNDNFEEDEMRRPRENDIVNAEQKSAEIEEIFQKHDFLQQANEFN